MVNICIYFLPVYFFYLVYIVMKILDKYLLFGLIIYELVPKSLEFPR